MDFVVLLVIFCLYFECISSAGNVLSAQPTRQLSTSPLYFFVHADWGKGGVDGTYYSRRYLKDDSEEDVEDLNINDEHTFENLNVNEDRRLENTNNQKQNNNKNSNNNQNQNQQSNKNQNKKQNVFYQGDIARAMAATAASTKPSFIMALGDNFYANGVSSTTDATWKTFFRDVYFNNFDTLKGIPWHPAFGNHDLGYGYTGIQAQLDRTSQSADVNDDNGEWQFPAAYYTVKYNIPGGGFVQVIVVDTTTLAPSTTSFTSSQGGISTETQAMRIMEQLEGLLDIFQATLRNPPTWLLVMGHYQMFSHGSKGDNAELLTYLLPLLSHYGVHAYFCGHDHINEHLQHNGIEYFIAGASTMTSTLSSSPSSLATLKWVGESFAAFARVTATAQQLTVDYINSTGTIVYSSSIFSSASVVLPSDEPQVENITLSEDIPWTEPYQGESEDTSVPTIEIPNERNALKSKLVTAGAIGLAAMTAGFVACQAGIYIYFCWMSRTKGGVYQQAYTFATDPQNAPDDSRTSAQTTSTNGGEWGTRKESSWSPHISSKAALIRAASTNSLNKSRLPHI